MVYYKDESILVRNMVEGDATYFPAQEIAQGWLNASPEKYFMRLEHARAGKCISLVAEYEGVPAGYIHVYPDCPWGAFGGMGYCELVDFGVLQKFQRRRIGTKLLDVAEGIAFSYGDKVYLGVRLHAGYGAAQRLYVKRGYVPDGSGVWYDDRVCPPYSDCKNDDGLILYLLKERSVSD